jgi:hypothetical protein
MKGLLRKIIVRQVRKADSLEKLEILFKFLDQLEQ